MNRNYFVGICAAPVAAGADAAASAGALVPGTWVAGATGAVTAGLSSTLPELAAGRALLK
jgi:hypothetical protein